MASARSLLLIGSLMVLLLMADVAFAQADLPQQQEPAAKAPITGSRKHLRGDLIEAAKEGVESFARRELSDYGGTPADRIALPTARNEGRIMPGLSGSSVGPG